MNQYARLATIAALLCVEFYAQATDDPLVLTPEKDVTIYSTNALAQWANEGSRGSIDLMTKSADTHRVLMCFALPKEAAAPCTAAILRLTAEEIWPNKVKAYIRIHRVMRPFSETAASWGLADEHDPWLSPGGDFDPVAVCARKLGREQGKNQGIDIDLTPLVQGWQTKQFPNYGLELLLDEGSATYAKFLSREAGADGPHLSLYYAAAAPKNPDGMHTDQLPPLGKRPEFKPEVTTTNFDAPLGKELSVPLRTQHGIPPYTWKISGLPAGIVANGNIVSGIPEKPGSYTILAEATDAEHHSASKKIVITVAESAPATIAAKDKPEAAKPAGEKKRAVDEE